MGRQAATDWATSNRVQLGLSEAFAMVADGLEAMGRSGNGDIAGGALGPFWTCWICRTCRPFWQLSPHFLTELPGECGPTTAIIVLNALQAQGLKAAVSPMYSIHFGNYSEDYHYWDVENLRSADSQCVKEHTIPWKGSLEQVAAFMTCHGAVAKPVEANSSSLSEFRSRIRKAFADEELRFLTINFDRQTLNQRGSGHHSPIAAYDEATDRVLVLDVARYKYPPWWAALPDVFAAMQSYAPWRNMQDAQPWCPEEPDVESACQPVELNIGVKRVLVASEDLSAYKLYELGVQLELCTSTERES
eukprot:Skav223111  [mRNA]  locus=scaffold419:751434:757300:+ [translate_table: standard]